MKENVIIRNERKEDWEIVETITRQAFYNLYVPGCVEHYLVHNMREHEDFISELDFVLELNGNVIGNIMYTKAKLIDENKNKKDILTFGPISIHPDYQRMGYGKMLIEHSFQAAIQLGYDTIVKELCPHVLDGHKWIYQESSVMAISEEAAAHYDSTLEPIEKKYLSSQEEFYIMSHSFVEE